MFFYDTLSVEENHDLIVLNMDTFYMLLKKSLLDKTRMIIGVNNIRLQSCHFPFFTELSFS